MNVCCRWLPSKTSERSRVGQKLSDLTTQKVIVGILAILLIIPVFNIYSGLYGTYSGLTQGGLHVLHDLYLSVSPVSYSTFLAKALLLSSQAC